MLSPINYLDKPLDTFLADCQNPTSPNHVKSRKLLEQFLQNPSDGNFHDQYDRKKKKNEQLKEKDELYQKLLAKKDRELEALKAKVLSIFLPSN